MTGLLVGGFAVVAVPPVVILRPPHRRLEVAQRLVDVEEHPGREGLSTCRVAGRRWS
jgi:hypothetical protein